MSEKFRCAFAAALLGACSLGVQVLFIRRLLTVFYGNELIIGVVMAMWLLWVGAGSALGARVQRRHTPSLDRFAALLILALLASAAGIALTHLARIVLGVPFGEFIPFARMICLCALLLPIPCLLFGALFSILAAAGRAENSGEPAAHVYAFETAGTAPAGILLALFGHHFSALFTLVLILAAAALMLFLIVRNKMLLILFALAAFSLASGCVQQCETRLVDVYWRSFGGDTTPVAGRTTRFGEIALLDWAGERWLYQNGAKVTALPDDISAHQLAATVFCAHPHPRKVLLIEGNLGGLPSALLRFDSLNVTIVELDQQAYAFVQRQNPLGQSCNPRLRVIHQDARRFLHRTSETFDILVVNSGNPTSAGANRYFTQEFFQAAKVRMAKGGVLIVPRLTSGENYLGDELAAFHKTMLNTLRRSFRQVSILSGNEATYLATDENALTFDAQVLTQRYSAGAAELSFFHPTMFPILFDSLRTAAFSARLAAQPSRQVNRDFRPISYLYDFLIWHKAVTGSQGGLLRLFGLPFWAVVSATTIVMLLLFRLLKRRAATSSSLPIWFAAGAVGFALMAINFILMLAFQTLFGYIYSWISAVIAAFMTGLAVGSSIMNRRLNLVRSRHALRMGLAVMLAWSALILPASLLCRRLDSMPLFAVLVFGVGLTGGALFALLCGWFRTVSGAGDVGGIYAADVFGGSAAALLLSAFMVPVYGFAATLLLCAVVVVFALLMTVNRSS